MSGYKLQWFRISFTCNSTTSEKAPSGKLTGGSYWFSCLPLINLYWCPNITGIKIWINPELWVSSTWPIKSWTRPLQSSFFSSLTAHISVSGVLVGMTALSTFNCVLKCAAVWVICETVLGGWDPVIAISGVLCSIITLRTYIVAPEVSLHNVTYFNIWKQDHWN